MDWNITIVRTDNGYSCEWYEKTEDDYIHHIHVIEERESECSNADPQLNAMESLLWFIKEHFGCYYNKHDSHNIYRGGEG